MIRMHDLRRTDKRALAVFECETREGAAYPALVDADILDAAAMFKIEEHWPWLRTDVSRFKRRAA